jgi:hypothetical protein
MASRRETAIMGLGLFRDVPAPLVGALVTAGVGFLGVVVTLLWNGWLARRADRRKFENEQAAAARKLADEQRVLRVALRAELNYLIKIMQEEKKHISKNDFTWVPLMDFLSVYRENAATLGILTPEEVKCIVNAYYTYREKAGYITRLGKDSLTNPIIGTNVLFKFDETPHKKREINRDLDTIATVAQEAVDAISSQLGKL